jgi:NAD(P)-dependent dehydrogenase (short-subunit alcohol dehydrogenase family)
MAEIALDRYGTIDILYANAGIFPAATLDELTSE